MTDTDTSVTTESHQNIDLSEISVENTYLLSFISESSAKVTQFVPEMALLLVVSIVCLQMVLNALNGRMSRMDQYIHNMDFEIFEYKEKTDRGAFYFYLSAIGYWYIVLPFIVVIYWALLLIYDSYEDTQLASSLGDTVCEENDTACALNKEVGLKTITNQYIGGFSVLLIGFSAILLLLSFMKIRWNNWRFKMSHLFLLLLSYCLFTIWQYLTLLSAELGSYSFYGLSSLFLTQNGFILTIYIFLNVSNNKFTLFYFINKYVKKDGEVLDPKRTDDFNKEILDAKANAEEGLYAKDIYDMVTIGKVSVPRMINAFGLGLQGRFQSKSRMFKNVTNIMFLVIYFALLGIYAYLNYYFESGSKLGLMAAITVFACDIFVAFIFQARIVDRVSMLCLFIFASRFLILVGGEFYWIYGYLVMYLVIGALLSMKIAVKMFPFNENPPVDFTSLKPKQKLYVDVSRMPEFILLAMTICLAIAIFLSATFKPTGVGFGSLNLLGTELKYDIASFCCVFVVLTIFVLQCTYRTYFRKAGGITGRTYIYLINKKVDSFAISVLFNYLIILAWTVAFYGLTKKYIVLLIGVVVPIILIFYSAGFLYYSKNDYHFLQNLKRENKKIQIHNDRLAKTKKQAKDLKRQIQEEGPETVFGDENAMLVVKVMQADQRMKEIQKLAEAAALQAGTLENEADDDAFENRVDVFAGLRKQKTKSDPTIMEQELAAADPNAVPDDGHKQVAGLPDDMDEDGENEGEGTALEKPKQFTSIGIVGNSLGKSVNDVSGLGQTMQQFQIDDSDSVEYDEHDQIPKKGGRTPNSRKRKTVEDWRENSNFCTAYFTKRLRSNDYRIIHSYIAAHLLVIVFGYLEYAIYEAKEGPIIATTLLHIMWCGISMFGTIAAMRKMTIIEIILLILSYILIYGVGCFYLYNRHNPSLLLKKNEDLDAEDQAVRAGALNFLFYFVLLIPFLTALFNLVATANRDRAISSTMSNTFYGLLVLNILHVIGLTVLMFYFYGTANAVISLIICFLFAYIGLQYTVKVKGNNKPIKVSEKFAISDYVMDQIWKYCNIIIVVGIFVGVILFSRSHPDFTTFQAFTLWITVIGVIMLILLIALFFADSTDFEENPIFHSAWLLPVYKYNAEVNDVVPHFLPTSLLIAFTMMILIWSLIATAELRPIWIGVAFSCGAEVIFAVTAIFLINATGIEFNEVRPYVDSLIVKQAWLDSKQNLVEMLNLGCRNDYITYEDTWRRRFELRQYINALRGRNPLDFPDTPEFRLDKEDFSRAGRENNAASAEYFKNKLNEWVDPDDVNLDSIPSSLSYLYDIDEDVRDAYMAEYETIVQFQLIILQLAKTLADQEKKYIFKFIAEKRSVLYLIGININISTGGKLADRFAALMSELSKLTPDKRTLFNALKDRFIDDERAQEQKEEAAAEEEERKNEERQNMLAQMSQAKRAMLANFDPSLPADQLPDCERKFVKIEESCHDLDEKFNDGQFPYNDEAKILGDTIINEPAKRYIKSWERASQMEGAVLFRDGANHEDIAQGALGDCYFLSALSVLGNERIREIFVSEQDNDDKWKKTGAFLLKFYKNGEPEFVIVDDFLPLNQQQQPAFTRGGEDGLEMWPAILEKGYAKMYGSYSFIEAGKVQMALADLTEQGFPEELKLATYKKNLKQFQNKLFSLDKVAALMGAGSPEHEQGDSACSEQGIIFGHAYAILDVDEFEGQQLVQLRNPHGKTSETIEWNGDWSDQSEQWNERSMCKLKYSPDEGDRHTDGVFWMSTIDFLANYKYIYICRTLKERDGWFNEKLRGEWLGASAAGFPGKFKNLPQFTLKVFQPCDGYISLRQMSDDATFRGKNYIAWVVANEDGMRIQRINKQRIVGKSALSNLSVISSNITFSNNLNYPCTLTIMCGSRIAGPEGEGKFELTVYTRDKKMQLKAIE